jgi:hypothetical protein
MNLFVLDFRRNDEGSGATSGVLRRLKNPGKPALSGEIASDFLRQVSRIVFITHGYNVNRSEGRVGLKNFASYLSLPEDEAVVAVLWPGDKENKIWSAASFPWQGNTANDTAKRLVTFITERKIVALNTRLSFITHSLGARVGMETIKRILSKKGYEFEQVCLMAPALVDYSLANKKEYREATESCDRVAVLASRMDFVLAGAFPIGNLFEVFPMMRKKTAGLALGWHGPRSYWGEPNSDNIIHEQIDATNNVGHGDYIPNKSLGYGSNAPNRSQKKGIAAAQYAFDVIENKDHPSYTINKS